MKKTYIVCALFTFLSFLGTYLYFWPDDFFLPHSNYRKDTKKFSYQHLPLGLKIYNREYESEGLKALIENPDKYIFAKDTQIIKSNEKRIVAKVYIHGKAYSLKRYHYKSWFDWLTKCPFRSSKAFRAWHYMHAFQRMTIKTANPVAIVEQKLGPVWFKTYLLSEWIEGNPLNEVSLHKTKFNFDSITQKILDVIDVFYKNHWLHRDFITRNMIINSDGLYVIDLDEMHAYFFRNACFKKKFFHKHFAKLQKKQMPFNLFKSSFLMAENYVDDYTCLVKNEQVESFE